MNTVQILKKERIVSLSDLQKNPSRALAADIVRITKNGKDFGIFLSKKQFEDILEEKSPLNPLFQEQLESQIDSIEAHKLRPLSDLFQKK